MRSLYLQQASRVAEQISKGGQRWPGWGSMLMRNCRFLSLLVNLTWSGAGPAAGPRGGGMVTPSAGAGPLPGQHLQHPCSPQGCSSIRVSAACSNLIRTRPCRMGLHELMALRGSEQHDGLKHSVAKQKPCSVEGMLTMMSSGRQPVRASAGQVNFTLLHMSSAGAGPGPSSEASSSRMSSGQHLQRHTFSPGQGCSKHWAQLGMQQPKQNPCRVGLHN